MPNFFRPLALGTLFLTAWAAAARAQEPGKLVVWPAQATVSEARFPQTLLVGIDRPDGVHEDLTRDAQFTSANPAIAQVDAGGRVTPVAPGETTFKSPPAA